jgi:hypothetical protein
VKVKKYCRGEGMSYKPCEASKSITVVAPTYTTRISITAPDTVYTNTPFDVTGKLEYQDLSGVWNPLPNQTVYLYVDGTQTANVKTGSDGSYKFTISIATAGTHTLRVYYPGSATYRSSENSITVSATETGAPPPPTPPPTPTAPTGATVASLSLASIPFLFLLLPFVTKEKKRAG